MKLTKLKPCPFCGGDAERNFDVSSTVFFVICRACGARVSVEYDGLYSDLRIRRVVRKWNRRMP